MQEPERAYVIARARGMVDGGRAITKCPAAARAKGPEEVKRKRVEAAPLYLKGRVEQDEVLPEVEVLVDRPSKRARIASDDDPSEEEGNGPACKQEEELRAVTAFVIHDLKAELLVELLQAIRPRWNS